MCTKEDTRQLQLERANLIENLSAARLILAAVEGHFVAEKILLRPSAARDNLLDRIRTYLKVGMFDELPQEIAR